MKLQTLRTGHLVRAVCEEHVSYPAYSLLGITLLRSNTLLGHIFYETRDQELYFSSRLLQSRRENRNAFDLENVHHYMPVCSKATFGAWN